MILNTELLKPIVESYLGSSKYVDLLEGFYLSIALVSGKSHIYVSDNTVIEDLESNALKILWGRDGNQYLSLCDNYGSPCYINKILIPYDRTGHDIESNQLLDKLKRWSTYKLFDTVVYSIDEISFGTDAMSYYTNVPYDILENWLDESDTHPDWETQLLIDEIEKIVINIESELCNLDEFEREDYINNLRELDEDESAYGETVFMCRECDKALIERIFPGRNDILYSAIKTWRLNMGVTQAEAAALFNVPAKLWSNWEQGRRIPSLWAEKLLLKKMQKYCKLKIETQAKAYLSSFTYSFDDGDAELCWSIEPNSKYKGYPFYNSNITTFEDAIAESTKMPQIAKAQYGIIDNNMCKIKYGIYTKYYDDDYFYDGFLDSNGKEFTKEWILKTAPAICEASKKKL